MEYYEKKQQERAAKAVALELAKRLGGSLTLQRVIDAQVLLDEAQAKLREAVLTAVEHLQER